MTPGIALLFLFGLSFISPVRPRHTLPGDVDASPLAPLEKMLTTNSKNPLVAATYYFNPGSLSRSSPDFSEPNPSVDEVKEKKDSAGFCLSADGRKGSCYGASECVARGGTPMGSCGSDLAGSVCCLFDVTCGGSAGERYVYFRNPKFPSPHSQPQMCRVRVAKASQSICQYRVDLLYFDLAPPNRGNCSQDIFVISGQNENNIVPKICGLNTGQHYYFGVEESGVITLHIMMLGNYQRKFDILVTQIPCQSELRVPSHCLQHLSGTHGKIKSFNYDLQPDDDSREGYPNDNDYTICVKKEPGFCSITYELALQGTAIKPFSIGPTPLKNTRLVNPIQTQCKDDFLIVAGVKLCSVSLASEIPSKTIGQLPGVFLNATFNSPTLVTDATPGPFVVRFVSNQAENGKGFDLNYKQNPCK